MEVREEGVLHNILVQEGEEVRPVSPIDLVVAVHEPLAFLEYSSATTRLNSHLLPPDETVTPERGEKRGDIYSFGR